MSFGAVLTESHRGWRNDRVGILSAAQCDLTRLHFEYDSPLDPYGLGSRAIGELGELPLA